MDRTTLVAVLLCLVLVGATVPMVTLAASPGESPVGDTTASAATVPAQGPSSVNVTVGPQLSTVIGVSSDEVQTEFENTAFDISFEDASEEERAEAIADRTDELGDRAETIREDYATATAAYEAGELTRSEYAQRLAALNARASNLLDSYAQLQQRAANVSAFELRAAGVSGSALDSSLRNLRSVTGAGTRALLERFTGESDGEVSLETEQGLTIEVESEDGERSREFERPRDGTDTLTVGQSDALGTARSALSSVAGDWVLTRSAVDEDDGAYVFTFALRNAPGLTGDAEVSVDGSTGEVFSLEEEVDRRDDEDPEDDSDRELAMVVADGTPAAGATVTVQVLANGAPVENAAVSLNDQVVGTTDADGRLTVTLPATDEVELTARSDDDEADLEFEFRKTDDGDSEVFQRLVVDATLDGETVTATVSYDGDAVENAAIYANGRAVGTTDSDGTVTFTVDTSDLAEVELDVVKGEFETELVYAVQDGTLSLVEADHEGGEDTTEGEQETESDSDDDEEAETDD